MHSHPRVNTRVAECSTDGIETVVNAEDFETN